jgi:hypothetical protein
MEKNFGHWVLSLENNQEVIKPYGFIYLITNNTNGKKYIGKKQCLTTLKRRPLKGKKNKRHEEKETDWKEYTSSCRELNEDIKLHGKDNFTFEILKWCESKADLAYSEIKMQIERDVLLRSDYYNGIINCRLRSFTIRTKSE